MMGRQTVWVDIARCTGCGACMEVCPGGAIALVDGKARVDEELCTDCGACVDACPEDAIQPVVTIQGAVVPAPERPALTVHSPSPLAETAGAVFVASTGLLMKAAGTLARAARRWLTRRFAGTGPSTGAASRAVGGTGGGRRARHRRRGG